MSSQPHFLGSMTLKALLEDPNLKNPPIIGQSNNLAKVKKEDGSDGPRYNYGSAFLGPPLWDKSYGMDLNLEYMDLDEFLSENDIPVNNDGVQGIALDLAVEDDPLRDGVSTPPNPIVSSPRQYLRTPPMSPLQYVGGTSPTATATVTSTTTPSFPAQPSPSHSHHSNQTPTGSPPGSPFNVEFKVSEQDMALTSIPDYEDPRYYHNAQGWIESGDGHRPKMGTSFDPRKRNFTDEELKPQPIIKKSKKIFVPEDLKDDKYWCRRLKNNFAAKRSRDARRVKENQIALRAAYLEKENKCLKDEMSKLQKENAKLKSIVDKYEPGASTNAGSWPTLSP